VTLIHRGMVKLHSGGALWMIKGVELHHEPGNSRELQGAPSIRHHLPPLHPSMSFGSCANMLVAVIVTHVEPVWNR
jgi:hypothetical protein